MSPPKSIRKFTAANRQHACLFCGMAWEHYFKLENHMNTHIDQRPYKCLQCPSVFRDPRHLSRHKQGIHLKVRYKCKKCGKKLSYRDSLNRHMRRCSGIRVASKNIKPILKPLKMPPAKPYQVTEQYSCLFCDKQFGQYIQLETHINTHLQQKPHQGLKCSDYFTECTEVLTQVPKPGTDESSPSENMSNLSKPKTQNITRSEFKTAAITKPGKKKRYQTTKCFVCPTIFSTRHTMIRHYRSIHLKTTNCVKIYSCVPCDLKFENQSQFTSHQITVHFKKHPCTKCGRAFARRDGLKRHLQMKRCSKFALKLDENTVPTRISEEIISVDCGKDSKSQKLQCRKCKVEFSRKDNLTQHIIRRQCCSVKDSWETDSESELSTEDITESEIDDDSPSESESEIIYDNNDDDHGQHETESEFDYDAESHSEIESEVDDYDSQLERDSGLPTEEISTTEDDDIIGQPEEPRDNMTNLLDWEELVLRKRKEKNIDDMKSRHKYDFFLHLNRYNANA